MLYQGPLHPLTLGCGSQWFCDHFYYVQSHININKHRNIFFFKVIFRCMSVANVSRLSENVTLKYLIEMHRPKPRRTKATHQLHVRSHCGFNRLCDHVQPYLCWYPLRKGNMSSHWVGMYTVYINLVLPLITACVFNALCKQVIVLMAECVSVKYRTMRSDARHSFHGCVVSHS